MFVYVVLVSWCNFAKGSEGVETCLEAMRIEYDSKYIQYFLSPKKVPVTERASSPIIYLSWPKSLIL